MNLTRKLIEPHLVSGSMRAGEEIALAIDQTLTQDATGTLVMLELEAMKLERVRTEISVQYVDHNLIQSDFRNPDDHVFLRSASRRFGVWFSRPGNGVSHPLHQERFGKPGKTLLGSDSHTCAAGAIGMFAAGAGGLDVAMAMAGHPFHLKMPRVWGIELEGALPPWVSAKDVILEMLRRHSVSGGVGRVIEYFGPGVDTLSAMDRHVIANMGAELGATTTVFPSDREIRRFLASQGREDDWRPLAADRDAEYDEHDRIDLGSLEPMIAMPSSPDNVCPVREVAGTPIYQCYIGSSANPGYRDFAVAAEILRGQKAAPGVSLDVNPTSRQILENLADRGHLLDLIQSGARIHQAGCNGCIGMGQAPATDSISLRTVPRNFPGRSGTREDHVCLVGPEVAAASALVGAITDPRDLDRAPPAVSEPGEPILNTSMFEEPPSAEAAGDVRLVKGANVAGLPDFDPLGEAIEGPVLLKVGDDISTDEIMPAGSRVLPFRSNVPRISRFVFEPVDEDYSRRAAEQREAGGHILVAGKNYGQGSSREHAALAPRYLGLKAVVAKGFSRIHWQNLVNFGILPLTFVDESDYDAIEPDDTLRIELSGDGLRTSSAVRAENITKSSRLELRHALSERECDVVAAGGLINWTSRNATD